MRTPKTPVSQNVTVTRQTEGFYDANENWVPGGTLKVADIEDANIVPKSGRERATALQTSYESDLDLIAGLDNIEFTDNFFKDGEIFHKILADDIVTDEEGNEYKVVFPGKFKGMVYVADLKGL